MIKGKLPLQDKADIVSKRKSNSPHHILFPSQWVQTAAEYNHPSLHPHLEHHYCNKIPKMQNNGNNINKKRRVLYSLPFKVAKKA